MKICMIGSSGHQGYVLSGVSKSKWIAELIKQKTASAWPEHISDLAGAWKDFPTAEEIREGMGQDAKREPL